MTYHFKCTLCGEEYESGQVRYVCPKHGDDGILDTIFDYKQIAATTIAEEDFRFARFFDLALRGFAAARRRANPHRRFPLVGRRCITRRKRARNLA